MNFKRHSGLEGQHAFLSASKNSWLNYDEDKLAKYLITHEAAARGSRLHALAHTLIKERVKLRDNNETLNKYVNDSISYRMTPELTLWYSEWCFGTPDAISFSENRKILRVSDLKTGFSPATEKQLLIYAALFFLEYGLIAGYRPSDVRTELRIYQNDEVREYLADPMDIMMIMEKIIKFDKLIKQWKEEGVV